MKTHFNFTAIVRSKSVSERSSIPRVMAMPALLTRMFDAAQFGFDDFNQIGHRVGLGDVGLDGDGTNAGVEQLIGQALGVIAAFAIIDGKASPGFRQCSRYGCANAARPAGYQCSAPPQTIFRHAISAAGKQPLCFRQLGT